jgi:hypothetical protein
MCWCHVCVCVFNNNMCVGFMCLCFHMLKISELFIVWCNMCRAKRFESLLRCMWNVGQSLGPNSGGIL